MAEEEMENQQRYAAFGIAAFIALLMLLMVFPTDWNAFTANVANFIATIGGAFSTIGSFITGDTASGKGTGLGVLLVLAAAIIGGAYYYTQNNRPNILSS